MSGAAGMRLGYVIIYVPDVAATMAFYEAAFGLERRFVHESGYGEMETGGTALAFAAEALAQANGTSFRPIRPDEPAPGLEIALVSDDPQATFDRAVAAGAQPVQPPQEKPWGQVVGYVRDLNGVLVELCGAIA